MSDANSMHSEPMKAQIAIFRLSRPVEVVGCPACATAVVAMNGGERRVASG